MKSFQCVIHDENGLHARPAGLLVRKAQSFQSEITVSMDGKTADMKKLFSLMSLNVKKGDRISVQVSGSDEEIAGKELEEYFKNNL